MREWKKLIIAIVGGFLAAFLWYLILAMLFNNSSIGWLFFLLLLGFCYFLYKRTVRAKHAAGWACVALSLGSFALPIGLLVFSASKMGDYANASGAEQVGAGIGAALVTGVGAVVGLFLGIIFAIAAYFLLKDSKKTGADKK